MLLVYYIRMLFMNNNTFHLCALYTIAVNVLVFYVLFAYIY